MPRRARARPAGAGIRLSDVTHLLLTHIHLDHAGATGTIVRRHPHIKWWCTSAARRTWSIRRSCSRARTRLYGDRDGRACGVSSLPVPERTSPWSPAASGSTWAAGRSRSRTRPATRRITSATSIASSGVAFVGDTGRRLHRRRIRAAADAAARHRHRAWQRSVARIEAWSPAHAVPDALRPRQWRQRASADADRESRHDGEPGAVAVVGAWHR